MTKRRFVIVGNQGYGLYYGEIDTSDKEIVETKSVRMLNCRHVARWYGRTGGITSLAAHGPCGKKAKESLIGAPAPSVLLTGVVNVLDCTPEAIAAFALIETNEDSGSGAGVGSGAGAGVGSGAGHGSGHGSGAGEGYGSGYGSGAGHGSGSGAGYGSGEGEGVGYGSGAGVGSGAGHGSSKVSAAT